MINPRRLVYSKEWQPECSLADVAAALGVSKERARQIEARALAKLRVALLRRGFRPPDFLDGAADEPALPPAPGGQLDLFVRE